MDKAYEETCLMRDHDVTAVEEVARRLSQQWLSDLVEAAVWKVVADSAAAVHLLLDLEQFILDRSALQKASLCAMMSMYSIIISLVILYGKTKKSRETRCSPGGSD